MSKIVMHPTQKPSAERARTSQPWTHVLPAIGMLLALAALWGSSYTFIKIAVDTIPPLTVAAVRVVLAALLLTLFVQWRGLRFPTSAATWRALLVQACFNSILPFSLITWGEVHIDSGLAGILNATPPIFVFITTYFWTRHEPATLRQFLGVICGLGGVVLIIGTDTLAGLGNQTLAQLAITAASVCYAIAAIYGRRFADLHPMIPAAATLICACVVLVPASLLLEQPWHATPSSASIAALVVLAVFSTALALILYFRILNTLGSMGVASNSYLRAGFSVLLGILFLGEHLSLAAAGGLALIVLGVVAIIGGPAKALLSRRNGGRRTPRT